MRKAIPLFLLGVLWLGMALALHAAPQKPTDSFALPRTSELHESYASLDCDSSLESLKAAMLSVDPKATVAELSGRRGVAFVFAGGYGLAEWGPGEVRLMSWFTRTIPFDQALTLVNRWNSLSAGGRAWVEECEGITRFCLATDAHIRPPVNLTSIVKILGAATLLSSLNKDYKAFVDRDVPLHKP